MKNYKITLKMGWEFIVTSQDEKEALVKTENYIDNLITKDGYTTMAMKAIDNIKSNEYSIDEYIGFVVV